MADLTPEDTDPEQEIPERRSRWQSRPVGDVTVPIPEQHEDQWSRWGRLPVALGRVQVCGRSDIGLRRARNEDHYLAAGLSRTLTLGESNLRALSAGEQAPSRGRVLGREEEAILLAVADGIGGHGEGQRASASVLGYLARQLPKQIPSTLPGVVLEEPQLGAAIKRVFHLAQRELTEMASAEELDAKLGTTLTVALVTGFRAYVGHAGDSRCYHFSRGTLHQLTRDHTVANRMAESSSLRSGSVPRHWHNVLWNAIGGGDQQLEVELAVSDIREGDRLLLCSDGLTAHVHDDLIADYLGSLHAPVEEICAGLVEEARRGGGADNITVVVAQL
jgi:protein phosphatase